MMDLAACDIGCDEYGYPIRVPVSPAGLAAGPVPNVPVICTKSGALRFGDVIDIPISDLIGPTNPGDAP